MSETDLTANEVFDSLTGFDEMEIATQFGRTVGDLLDDNSMWARSLIFVVRRRVGDNDDDARNFAMGLRLADLGAFFAKESAGDSAEGKGEPVSEQPPSSPSGISLTSVS